MIGQRRIPLSFAFGYYFQFDRRCVEMVASRNENDDKTKTTKEKMDR
jgi:hypothetical protein